MNIIESKNLSELQFEIAKRSLICNFIEAQDTVKSAIFHTILNITRKINNSFQMHDFKIC